MIFKKIKILLGNLKTHTYLHPFFMDDDGPSSTGFVGSEHRHENIPGFIDDRKRNANGYVEYAPRKVVPDLKGGGILVPEDYPISSAAAENLDIIEANVPRQARGVKDNTLTAVHDQLTTFDVAVAKREDTEDPDTNKAWDGRANPTTTQPTNPFSALYPYNHVRETESGHLFEADDTPGSERIKEAHRSGTYYEIQADGSKVEKIVRDNFTVIVGNDRVNIQGGAIVTIEGDCNLLTRGNFTHQVDGDYNLLVRGKYIVDVADDVGFDFHSDYYHYVGKPIDVLKLDTRGNSGGDARFEGYNQYIQKVRGDVTRVYGHKDLWATGDTVTHSTLVFGDEKNICIGSDLSISPSGFRLDYASSDHTEICGGDYSFYTEGDSDRVVHGDERHIVLSGGDFVTASAIAIAGGSGLTQVITKSKTQIIGEDKTETITGDKTQINISGDSKINVLLGSVTQTVYTGSYTASSVLSTALIGIAGFTATTPAKMALTGAIALDAVSGGLITVTGGTVKVTGATIDLN